MNYFDTAIKILKKIESLGYDAYIVGGVVRDYLLNLEVYDIDLTTNMPLSEINKNFQTIENGKEYLSITIVESGFKYEITHFRTDLEYINHRHPKTKEVNTLKEDIIRRDYTINAIAIDSNNNVIDYVNGKQDLNNGIIRLIGDYSKRYDEDCLRILRGLYLASKLGFEIEDNTLKSIGKWFLANRSIPVTAGHTTCHFFRTLPRKEQ